MNEVDYLPQGQMSQRPCEFRILVIAFSGHPGLSKTAGLNHWSVAATRSRSGLLCCYHGV